MDNTFVTNYLHNIDKDIQSIQDKFQSLVGENIQLRNEIENYSKDVEIVELNNQIADLRKKSLLIMTDNECDELHAFRARHYEMHKLTRHSSDTYIYELTGTGVGTLIKVKCPICNEEKDITDVGCW